MSLPVAHALVGACIYSGLEPRVDFCTKRTAWTLALLLPVLPDLDFAPVWFLGLPVTTWHRTFSHSLLFAVACALVAAWIWRQRPVPAAAFVGALVLSHALVDMC